MSVMLCVQPPQFLFLVAVVVAFPWLACHRCLAALWGWGPGCLALTQPHLPQPFCSHIVAHRMRSFGMGPHLHLEQKGSGQHVKAESHSLEDHSTMLWLHMDRGLQLCLEHTKKSGQRLKVASHLPGDNSTMLWLHMDMGLQLSGTKKWSAFESCVPFTRGPFHHAVISHGHGPSTLSRTKVLVSVWKLHPIYQGTIPLCCYFTLCLFLKQDVPLKGNQTSSFSLKGITPKMQEGVLFILERARQCYAEQGSILEDRRALCTEHESTLEGNGALCRQQGSILERARSSMQSKRILCREQGRGLD